MVKESVTGSSAPLSVRFEVGRRRVDVALDCASGDTTAIVGPNGAGKSTTLNVVAGLLRPDRGEVLVGDRVWVDTRHAVDVPAHLRRAALLLQNPTLFPHLSVRDNVAFGARTRGLSRLDARRMAEGWLERVGALPFAARHAHELSGGQAARVSIARALAADPPVVLLDEPLAALDVDSAAEVRAVLSDVLDGRTCLMVSHDVRDVAAIADRVIVLEDGRVVEEGPVADVLVSPRSGFGAAFVGRNVLLGQVQAGVFRSGELQVPLDLADGPARISFAPSAVHLTHSGSTHRIERLESHGAYTRVVAEAMMADLPAPQAATLQVGDRLMLSVDPAQVTVARA